MDTINYRGNGRFERNMTYLKTTGAVLICMASGLATQQVLLKFWPILLFIGLACVFISVTAKKIMSVVSSDVKLKKLNGIRLKGT